MRRALAATLLAAAIAAAPVSAGTSRPAASLSTFERAVVADINAYRAGNHLSPLRLSASLTTAARSHSLQMETEGYFAHDSADGMAFWKRIESFYPAGTFAYWSVGENLLWSSANVDAKRAVDMWIASPEHRKNMLDPHWQEIGVSAVHSAGAPGVYHGLAVMIVTTDFGVRR
ncbi:MAG: CAP domain-containing protein [Gaiellaceae bacterium]